MAGRNRQSLVAAGVIVLWGGLTGGLALLGHERAAFVGLVILVVLVGLICLATFARVSNAVRMLVATRREKGAIGVAVGGAPSGGLSEVAERRILAVIEAERLRAADRHREVLKSVAEGSVKNRNRLLAEVRKSNQDETRSVEAILQLQRDREFRAPMPPSGRWALDGRSLLELMAVVEDKGPKLLLELGSGTSTVWLGYALERTGGKVVSVEHDQAFADVTSWNLERHRLTETVDLRVAPLTPWDGEGSTDWYDGRAFEGLEQIDLLLVDGPPAGTGAEARYPAVPVLLDRLAPGGLVVLDDSDRPDERHIIERWLGANPRLTRRSGDFGRLTVLELRDNEPSSPVGTSVAE